MNEDATAALNRIADALERINEREANGFHDSEFLSELEQLRAAVDNLGTPIYSLIETMEASRR